MSQLQPNPQGKGLTPLLNDWQYYRPLQARKKSPSQLFADYFTSMLVLSAEFSFKPVIGQRYYLYCKSGRWHLSLIEPERWDRQQAGDCLGECRLHRDMTWSITPHRQAGNSSAIKSALGRFATDMDAYLKNSGSDQHLPYFAAQLPYYRRLAASGLAQSIKASSGDAQLELALAFNASNWQTLLRLQ